MSKDQSPSQRPSDSQSSLVGAFLNVSATGHEAGQQEEFHPQSTNWDMAEEVYIEEMQQEDPQAPEEPQQPSNMIQEEIIVCESVLCEESTLNLVTTPDGEPVFGEYGLDTWAAASSKAGTDKKDELEHA